MLEVIDDIVKGKHIAFGGHFRMERNHTAARAVIVHDQVMAAEDVFIKAAYKLLYRADKFRLRRGAEKRVDRLFGCADARNQNEYADDDAEPAVKFPAEEMLENRGKKHGARCDAVA